jgi:hypothetical protein
MSRAEALAKMKDDPYKTDNIERADATYQLFYTTASRARIERFVPRAARPVDSRVALSAASVAALTGTATPASSNSSASTPPPSPTRNSSRLT